MRRFIIISVLILAVLNCAAIDPGVIQSRWEAGMKGGYVFNSNSVLLDRMLPDGTVTHGVMSWHLRYSYERPEGGRNASVYQGVGVSVATLMQPHRIGTPAGFYVFQGAPMAVINDRLSLDYEWNFGATLGWHKTNGGDDIRSNLVVGSKANAYINFGVKFNYIISSDCRVAAGLDMSHYSNGNTSWPNPGVNTVGAAIGLVYTPGGGVLKPVSPFADDEDFTQGVSYDITAFGAWRKAYFPVEDGAFTEVGEKALLPGHFGVAGFCVSPMWDVHSTFRTGMSADIQWSENTNLTRYHVPGTSGEDTKFYRPPFIKQVSAGLSARAELVMPIFAVNAGVGYGILGPNETRKLYQILTLKAYVAGPVYLNIGYRLVQFRSPSNLMLGVGVTLGRR